MKIRMKKKSLGTLALAGVLLASPIVAFAAEYKDVSSDFWAYKHIDKLTDKGIIQGFEDGKYYPLRSVSYLEVLKLLEGVIEPSASEMEEAIKDYGSMADKYGVDDWAKEAVSISLAKGIITETNLKEAASKGLVTSKPRDGQFPSRQTVAVLYARALGLEPNKDHSVLEYDDLDEIGVVQDQDKGQIEVADYLSALVRAGIFNPKGNEGVFQPERPIRRSEIAKVTDLSYDYMSELDILEGKIIYVSNINGLKTVAFTDKDGKTKAAIIDSTTKVLKDGKSLSSDALKEGQVIKITGKTIKDITDYRAVKIEIVNSELRATGKILTENKGEVSIAYTLKDDIDFSTALKTEKTEDFTLDKDVSIKAYDKDVTLSSIRSDDYIEFVAEDNVISEIKVIPKTASVIGTIEKLEADSKEFWNTKEATLSLKLSDGKIYDFKVKDSDLIDSLLEDNKKGKKQEVILNYDKVTKVQDPIILEEGRGLVTGVSVEKDKKFIQIYNLSDSKAYRLADSVTFKDSKGEGIFASSLTSNQAITELTGKYINSWVELKVKNGLVEEIVVKNHNLQEFNAKGVVEKLEVGNPFTNIENSPWLITANISGLSTENDSVKFFSFVKYPEGKELELKGYHDDKQVLILYVDDKLVNVQP